MLEQLNARFLVMTTEHQPLSQLSGLRPETQADVSPGPFRQASPKKLCISSFGGRLRESPQN